MSELDVIELVRHDMDRLRGRLFGLIEAIGLPERQERALKTCVRNTSYDAQADLESALRNWFAEQQDAWSKSNGAVPPVARDSRPL